jgi:hypothetical protein
MILRSYTSDVSWYGNYVDKLVAEARQGFAPAVARMIAHVPRLATRASGEALEDATVEDGRLVYAREHGFETWPAFAGALADVEAGRRLEPFIAFIHAVEEDEVDAVARALDAAPDLVGFVGSAGKSALHSAPSVRMIRLLLERGAPVALEAPLPGGTPLMHWLVWGAADNADVLAAVSLAPANLRVAAGLGRLDLLAPMWDRAGLTAAARAKRDYYRPNYGWHPWQPGTSEQEVLDEALIYAATNGRIEAAQYLLDRGATVNGVVYGTTALGRAATKGRLAMVDWLLAHGAEVDAHAWLGGYPKRATPLHLAASTGEVEVIKRLVAGGASLDARDDEYQATPEEWARHFGQQAAAACLRSFGGSRLRRFFRVT